MLSRPFGGEPGLDSAAVASFVDDSTSTLSAPSGAVRQWALRRMKVDRAWDVTRASADIVVAVIDTGVDATHPDLAGVVVSGATFVSRVSPVCEPTGDDDNGHGTHIAGIIGAAPNIATESGGVAYGVRILPVKVLDCTGTGSTSDIAAGIVWATDHGARIVNVSLGSPTSSASLADAVRYASSHDVLVLAAAGNCGVGGGRCRYVNSPEYPAALDGVVAVGATDVDDTVTSFSTRGSRIGVVAPGVRIVSTTPLYATYQSARGLGKGYGVLSGTSQATAFVAGVAALIWSAQPLLSADDVTERLAAYADDLGPRGRDDASGAGRVNALRALQQPTRVSPSRFSDVPAGTVGLGTSDAAFPRLQSTHQAHTLTLRP